MGSSGFAKATGLSGMLDGEMSHDKVTWFLSEREYTSKDVCREVKSTVRKIEGNSVGLYRASGAAGCVTSVMEKNRKNV